MRLLRWFREKKALVDELAESEKEKKEMLQDISDGMLYDLKAVNQDSVCIIWCDPERKETIEKGLKEARRRAEWTLPYTIILSADGNIRNLEMATHDQIQELCRWYNGPNS